MSLNLPIPSPVITAFYTIASPIAGLVSPLLVDGKRIERIKNVAYGADPAQRLDVYLPRARGSGPLPVALFIHGGGFRYFSKNSHAAAAARLAESGRVVFCIDYRLAPRHPYPHGLADAAKAYAWIVENAGKYGGDPARISLVGESSGAGFVTSLAVYLAGIAKFPAGADAPEPPKVWPKAVVAHCGFFEVTDGSRFDGDLRLFPAARTRVEQIRSNYVPEFRAEKSADYALADPRLALGALSALPAGFPEFFVPVGAKDPVIGDSERFAETLAKLGQRDRLKVYPGVGHAFYAAPSGAQAKICWNDIVAFLDGAKA